MNKKKTIAISLITFLVIAILLIAYVEAQQEKELKRLSKGKNLIKLDKTSIASELIRNNPHIEAISYKDPKTNQTMGYVNVNGGIGKNILLLPSEEYEIISRNEAILKE
jgi:hypothetical protein